MASRIGHIILFTHIAKECLNKILVIQRLSEKFFLNFFLLNQLLQKIHNAEIVH